MLAKRAAIAATLSIVSYWPAVAQPQGRAPETDLFVAPSSAYAVASVCQVRLNSANAALRKFEAMTVRSSPKQLLRAYDDLLAKVGAVAGGELYLIKETNPDLAIQAAAEKCLEQGSALATQMGLSRPIYDRLVAAARRGSPAELRYALSRTLAGYERSGIDRLESIRRQIAVLDAQLTRTELEFERNIRESAPVVAARQEELLGLPVDFHKSLVRGADGEVRLPITPPVVRLVLREGRNAELRRRVMSADFNRAWPENVPVLQRLIEERTKLASLLGSPSYAHLTLKSHMARSPDGAQRFLDDIAEAARPRAQRDLQRQLARLQREDPSIVAMNAWSLSYARELVRSEDHKLDAQMVRPYFRYDRVRDGLFSLTQDIFGVTIRPLATRVWAPGVEAYELVEHERVIGVFFVDAHPRKGKYGHNSMSPLRVGTSDGPVPAASLVMNLSPDLLDHGEVVIFFHEFGHLLHHLFSSRQQWVMLAIGLERDSVEAPSRLFEEWAWDYETLRRFAKNDAGEPIPSDLVHRMNAARNFGEAQRVLDNIGFAAASLEYFSGLPPRPDVSGVFRRSFGRYAVVPDPDGTHAYASLGHLVGYGPAYYTYIWSNALAEDLLTPFRAAGLRDPATARRYRNAILNRGASASMSDLVRAFLGREWSPAALKVRLQRAD